VGRAVVAEDFSMLERGRSAFKARSANSPPTASAFTPAELDGGAVEVLSVINGENIHPTFPDSADLASGPSIVPDQATSPAITAYV
jgi:hypothetical protein